MYLSLLDLQGWLMYEKWKHSFLYATTLLCELRIKSTLFTEDELTDIPHKHKLQMSLP